MAAMEEWFRQRRFDERFPTSTPAKLRRSSTPLFAEVGKNTSCCPYVLQARMDTKRARMIVSAACRVVPRHWQLEWERRNAPRDLTEAELDRLIE